MPKIPQILKLQTIFKEFIMQNIPVKNSKTGQTTVEYILLLIVLVFIVAGLRETLFKSFNNDFMPSFKDYYVCSMETAALPGIRGSCAPPTWDPNSYSWPASGASGGSSWRGGGSSSWSSGGSSSSSWGGHSSSWSGGGSSWGGGGSSSWSRGSSSSWRGGGSSSSSWGGYSSSWGGSGSSSWGGSGSSSWRGGGSSSSSWGGRSSSWGGSGSSDRSSWGEYSSNNPSAGVSNIPKDSFPVSGKGKGKGKGKNNKPFNSYNNQFLAQSSPEGLDDNLNDKRKRKQKRKKFKVKRKKDNTSTLTSANRNRSNHRSSQGDSFLISSGGYDFDEKNEVEKRQTAIAISSDKPDHKSDARKRTSFAVDNKNKQQIQTEDPEPLTFSKFMKYIFIGLLLLGILFFIGSQLMQVNENLKAS